MDFKWHRNGIGEEQAKESVQTKDVRKENGDQRRRIKDRYRGNVLGREQKKTY